MCAQGRYFWPGKGRHCVTGAGTLQHQRQQPDSPHLRGKLHAAAQRKVGHKVAAQPDHGERAAVRVLEDIELFLGIAIAAKGITGVGVTIQMDAARDPDRIRQKPAARTMAGSGRLAHTHHSTPLSTPTSGKAQSEYRMFFSFQSNCGTGTAENMANATAIVCKTVMGVPSFVVHRQAAHHAADGVGFGGNGIVDHGKGLQIKVCLPA